MVCPGCSESMEREKLEDHGHRPVVIDVCFGCQVFWFDERESIRLSAGSTLTLFRTIGERQPARRRTGGVTPACPRCGVDLVLTHDRQRDTRFEYLRCPNDHGRLTTFFNFLREKNFIKPLSAKQIEELRQHLQSVNCSNCGAPVDLAKGEACRHCGSPLSMLDVEQAATLIQHLRDAEQKPDGVDPNLPLRLAEARRESDAAFGGAEGTWLRDASRSGLVGAGLISFARWLSRRP